MPSKYLDSEILERLLRRDDTALAILYEAYANDLLAYFKTKFKTTDEEILQNCVCDSLIEVATNPERYQPGKSALRSYLTMDINRNILNAIDKESRRKGKIVELSISHRNNDSTEEEFEEINAALLGQRVKEFFKLVFNNSLDETLAWMIVIERVKNTNNYIHLLHLQDLTIEEQKAEVKRHKDRINLQLRRKGWVDFTKKLKEDVAR